MALVIYAGTRERGLATVGGLPFLFLGGRLCPVWEGMRYGIGPGVWQAQEGRWVCVWPGPKVPGRK